MNTTFSNHYGTLELMNVTDFQPVGVYHFEMVPADCLMTMEQAEQIALITGNKKIQLCFKMGHLDTPYIVVHDSSSTAALAKIVSLNFMHKNDARNELARIGKYYSYSQSYC